MSTTPTAAKGARARWRRGLGIAGLATAAVGAALVAHGSHRGLPGGIELVYTTDLDLAVDDRLRQVTGELADSFAVAPWQGDAAAAWNSAHGYLLVGLRDPRRRDEALRAISARAGRALAVQSCPPDEPADAVCLRVPAVYREQLRRSLLDEAGDKVRARLGAIDVEAVVFIRGQTLVVDVAVDAGQIEHIETLLARSARFEFARVIADVSGPGPRNPDDRYGDDLATFVATDPAAADEQITREVDEWRAEESTIARTMPYLLASDRRAAVDSCEAREIGCSRGGASDARVNCLLTGRHVIERYLFGVPACQRPGLVDRDPRWKVPAGRRLAFQLVIPGSGSARASYWRSYLLDRAPIVTGGDVVNAISRKDPNTNRPIVQVEFDAAGRRRFADFTTSHVGDKMAIVLDNQVNSAPIINGPIAGGSAIIAVGGVDQAQAETQAADLAAVLRATALRAPLVLDGVTEVAAQPGSGPGPAPWILVGVGAALVVAFTVWTMRARSRG